MIETLTGFMCAIGWPAILVGLIYYLANLRVKAHADASEAALKLLEDYRQSHAELAKVSQISINKLTEEFTILLRHDAQMAATQLEVLSEALSEKTRSNNDFALRLVQTFVVALNAKTGDSQAAEAVAADLDALNRSRPTGNDGRPDSEFVPPMHQG